MNPVHLDAGAKELVTESAAMKRVAELIERVAATEADVLVLGESGTGKDLVARQVYDRSPRHGSPYISIDCASLPEELLESELFGYEKGGARLNQGEQDQGGRDPGHQQEEPLRKDEAIQHRYAEG